MYLVGLTGGIATGKSTASAVFRERGIPVIDADLIAREVVEPSQPAYRKLRAQFGNEIFDDENGGVLVRAKLAQLIFSNPEIRRKVNAITHPEIRKEIFRQILRNFFSGAKYVVLDTPLLFEVGYDKVVQKIVLIDCSASQQLERLKARDNLDEASALARIEAQMSMAEKRSRSTHIIDNSGDRSSTIEQVNAVIDEFDASRLHLVVRGVLLATIFALAYTVAKLLIFL